LKLLQEIKKMSAFCSCGELIPPRNDKCVKCGKSRSDGVVLNAGGGQSIPAANTSGGKWGTFETHAQRSKGQTTEESMKAIDDFVGGGAKASGVQVEKVEASTKLTSGLQGMLAKNGIKGDFVNSYQMESGSGSGSGGGSGSGTGKGGKAQVITEVTETQYHVDGDFKAGLVQDESKFKAANGPSVADAFLNQHKDKEAAKFKPQQDGKFR
jgi:hypothetical protein